ncbi:MAG: hypothetical protein WA081_05015 [Desulfosalsimonadaceae bacterium]
MNLPVATNGIDKINPGMPLRKASFCPRHGNHRVREFSASRGGFLLLLFFARQRKVNKDKELSMISVEG